MQAELGEVIKKTIKRAGPKVTQEKLAGKMGLSYAQLNNRIRAHIKWKPGELDELRELLNKPKEWPFSEITTVANSPKMVAGMPSKPIPVVGNVAAGSPVGSYVDDDLIWVPEQLAHPGTRGWVVEGDSMIPFLQPYDIAIVREHKTERLNYPFLIRVDGGHQIKLLKHDGKHFIFHSLNPTYPDVTAFGELVGYLVGIVRIQGSRVEMLYDPNGLKPDD